MNQFASHSTFAAHNTMGVDVLIKLESIEVGLKEVAKRLNHTRRCHLTNNHNYTSIKLKGGRFHSIPSSKQLHAALMAQPGVVRDLCDTYYQDYVNVLMIENISSEAYGRHECRP